MSGYVRNRIYDLPNEIKEKIFLQVYERQCYDLMMKGTPTRDLFELIWIYKNDLARAITWKWLVWWLVRILIPENLKLVQDAVYGRFRRAVHKSYQLLYENHPLPTPFDGKEAWRWWTIPSDVNVFLKTQCKPKHRQQIEKHILSYHSGEAGLRLDEKRRLIVGYRSRYPRSFLGDVCDQCGGDSDAPIVYPCKHGICKACFLGKVSKLDRSCSVVDLNKEDMCDSELKQRGWNYYIRKVCPHAEYYHQCKRCGYYRHETDFFRGEKGLQCVVCRSKWH